MLSQNSTLSVKYQAVKGHEKQLLTCACMSESDLHLIYDCAGSNFPAKYMTEQDKRSRCFATDV